MAKAVNARNWGLPLRSDGNRYSAPPITPPTIVPVVNSASQITVTASGGASTLGTSAGYRYRRNGIVVNSTPSAEPLVDTGLFASTTYFYTATYVDSAGNESALSVVVGATTNASSDQIAPTVPVITAQSLSASSIRIALTTASTDSGGSGFNDYTLEVAISGSGPWAVLQAGMFAASFPYTHSGLTGATTRHYRLIAFDNAGNASTSAVVSATTGGVGWIGGNDTTTGVPVTIGTPVDFDVAAQVVGEQSIALVSGSAPGLTYNAGTMRVTGTPTTEGSYSLLFRADDGGAA